MSTTDHRTRPTRAALGQLPAFDLAFRFDDDERPSEVTVFPQRPDDDLATHWITIDVGHAVALDRVR